MINFLEYAAKPKPVERREALRFLFNPTKAEIKTFRSKNAKIASAIRRSLASSRV